MGHSRTSAKRPPSSLTYSGKPTKTAFRTNNTIQNLLLHKQQTSDTYSRSGVYKLTCPDRGKAYVGQTGRRFATRFREHKKAIRTASRSSNFAIHLINHTHSFGLIHNIMQRTPVFLLPDFKLPNFVQLNDSLVRPSRGTVREISRSLWLQA